MQASFSYWLLFNYVYTDGFTHWSLTGSMVADEDTFMGFNDGLSQSGIIPVVTHYPHLFIKDISQHPNS